MKCKTCGYDMFPGQFRCQKCGTIHPTEGVKETTNETSKETVKKTSTRKKN